MVLGATLAAATLLLVHQPCLIPATVPKLNAYNVDTSNISLSGFSDGGSFAVQFHVAFSKTFMGVGIAAGGDHDCNLSSIGPYWCAKGNTTIAAAHCLSTTGGANADDYVDKAMKASDAGRIDPVDYMVTDWVRLFSAANDTIVSTDVVANTAEFYYNFVEKGYLYAQFDVHGDHAMLTDNYGNSCFDYSPPYINNCRFSNAQRFIQTIYQNITLDVNGSMIDENLLEFDQSEFIVGLQYSSMDSVGYIYVPSACQSKTKACRLHLVFHGCEQGREKIGSVFAMHAEYNGVAEINDIIMLYPQVKSDASRNPQGCWDWVGYTNENYIYQDGLQMAVVKRILDRAARL